MTENIKPETGHEKSGNSAPEARQWRVGTISMGLSLVSLGVVLILGRLSSTFTIVNLLKFWPLILVVLGLEMVLFNLLTVFKGGRVRFTYDILSIFLVLLLLFISSGLVALESTGVLNLAQRALQISERYIEAEKVLYTADETLKSLNLDIDEGSTSLRTYQGNEIKVSVVYNGYFASREEANLYAQDQFVRTERVGDTLFVQLYPPERGYLPNNYIGQEVTVLIPEGLDVELTQARGGVNVSLEGLQSNWIISHHDSYHPLDVVLEGMSDAKVRVELNDNGRLQGNVDWDSEQKDESSQRLVEAEKIWGQGSYTLVLRQSGGTTQVNSR